MKILYDNQITTSTTITASTENSNFKFSTAFADKRQSRFGRFLGKTSETLVFNNTSDISFDEVLVANSNISSSATVTIQANATDTWTSPSVSQTLSRQTNGYYYYNFSSVQTYAYVRLVVADSSNTESYIEISKVFIGQGLVLPGINADSSLPTTSNSVVSQSQSGQVFTDRRTQLKGAGVTFPTITETERQTLKSFFSVVDKTEPFYLLLWENDLDVEPPLYSSLTSDLEIQKLKYLEYTVSFEFIENK